MQDEGAFRGATCFHYYPSPAGTCARLPPFFGGKGRGWGEGNNLCLRANGRSRPSYGDRLSAHPCEGVTGVDFAAWLPASHRPAGR
jgi:hypothetical protein